MFLTYYSNISMLKVNNFYKEGKEKILRNLPHAGIIALANSNNKILTITV